MTKLYELTAAYREVMEMAEDEEADGLEEVEDDDAP